MSYSSELQVLRAHFGLSQGDLARWLGLSQSMMAHVEAGRKQLPKAARPWLRPWLRAWASSEASAPPPTVPIPPPVTLPPGPAVLLARWAECRYQAKRLGQELTARRAALRYAERLLAAETELRKALLLPPAPTDTPEAAALALRRRWLNRLVEAATDALLPEAPAGPAATALLAARCSAWEHEAAWLMAYLTGATAE